MPVFVPCCACWSCVSPSDWHLPAREGRTSVSPHLTTLSASANRASHHEYLERRSLAWQWWLANLPDGIAAIAESAYSPPRTVACRSTVFPSLCRSGCHSAWWYAGAQLHCIPDILIALAHHNQYRDIAARENPMLVLSRHCPLEVHSLAFRVSPRCDERPHLECVSRIEQSSQLIWPEFQPMFASHLSDSVRRPLSAFRTPSWPFGAFAWAYQTPNKKEPSLKAELPRCHHLHHLLR